MTPQGAHAGATTKDEPARSDPQRPGAAEQVTVITVTYGDRWAYLSQLLEFAAAQPAVRRVVVVDNHSTQPIEPLVEQAGHAHFVTVLTESRNSGSAAAFGRALRFVVEQGDPDFVYLLDDDNLPESDAIPRLLERTAGMASGDVLLSLRKNRRYLMDAVNHRQNLRYRLNAFCDNDIWRSIGRRLGLLRPAPCTPLPAGVDIESDYAPYGGMLFSAELPRRIGYPNADYFVYADDYEYVCRIRAAGGTIRLCPDSVIADLEEVWFDADQKRGVPAWFSPASTDFRVFYSVRNRVALERAWLVTRPLPYFAGGFVLVLVLAVKALQRGVHPRFMWHRLKLVWRAIRAGWLGDLGEARL